MLIGINGMYGGEHWQCWPLHLHFPSVYHLAKAYDVNPLAGGLVALASFVTILAQSATFNYQLPDVAVDALNTLKVQDWNVALNDTKML